MEKWEEVLYQWVENHNKEDDDDDDEASCLDDDVDVHVFAKTDVYFETKFEPPADSYQVVFPIRYEVQWMGNKFD